MTKEGKPYGPEKYKQLVKSCWIIAKNSNSSYTEIRDKITPTEMGMLLNLIKEEADKNNEAIAKMKKEREEKRQNSRSGRANYR